MKITKHRQLRFAPLIPCWRLYLDGRRLPLFIEKAAEKPHWGGSQEYDLDHDDHGFIATGSVAYLVSLVQILTETLQVQP